MGIWEINAWKLMQAGGPVMYLILLCSFFALTVIIERFLYYASIRTNTQKLKKSVFDLVKNDNIHEAIELCDRNPSPIAKILKAGLAKFGSSREELKEAIEDASLYVVPKLEQKLPMLATIAHISPLLGLLGTVTGLASSFHTIQQRATSLNPVTPGDLAGGIWEALLTTVAGLIVAIPAFVFYNYFVSQVNRFILQMEHSATELINVICQITESGK
ncbi:MAG: MotA/TolQ/ExbB proton channel family protein [Candidatus Omnitrophota bacterium]